MSSDRPIMSLEELGAFDPHAPQGKRQRAPLFMRGTRNWAVEVLSLRGEWASTRAVGREATGGQRADRGRTDRALDQAFGLRCAIPLSAPLPIVTEAVSLLAPAEPPAPSASQGPLNALSGALRGLQPLKGSRGETYLQTRGLPLDVCLSAKVKWAPSWLGRLAVVFPIYDDKGALVAAQGRYTDRRDDPICAHTGPQKEQGVPDGWLREQVQKGAPVIITEGPIDALSLSACGFPALALCGKSGWPQWLPIRCAFKEVVLAFDADDAGEDGAAKLALVLESLGAKVRRAAPEGAKDWNEMLSQRGVLNLDEWLSAHILSR